MQFDNFGRIFKASPSDNINLIVEAPFELSDDDIITITNIVKNGLENNMENSDICIAISMVFLCSPVTMYRESGSIKIFFNS